MQSQESVVQIESNQDQKPPIDDIDMTFDEDEVNTEESTLCTNFGPSFEREKEDSHMELTEKIELEEESFHNSPLLKQLKMVDEVE